MHIPKLLAVFSMAFCAVTLHAQRPDSDIQAQAREALRKAMGDTSPVTAPSNTPPAVVAKPPVQPATKPVPVVTTPAPATAPPAQLPPRTVRMQPQPQPQVSPAEQIKQMEIQRANALNQAAPVAPVTPPVTTPMSTPAQTMLGVTPAKTLSADEQEKAREAVRKQMDQMDAKTMPVVAAPVLAAPAKPVVTAPVVAKPVPTVAKTTPPPAQPAPPAVKTVATPAPAASVTAAPPVMSAPAPAAGSKEARLADLLQQYKAGSISPMEYQERRAKIRAEADKQ